MGKTLHFIIRGSHYSCNEQGWIRRHDMKDFEPAGDWVFLGVQGHHWNNHITTTRAEAFEHPEKIIGGMVHDLDHGTHRVWSGSYNGKLPRITSAWVE